MARWLLGSESHLAKAKLPLQLMLSEFDQKHILMVSILIGIFQNIILNFKITFFITSNIDKLFFFENLIYNNIHINNLSIFEVIKKVILKFSIIFWKMPINIETIKICFWSNSESINWRGSFAFAKWLSEPSTVFDVVQSPPPLSSPL